jgi:catechol 2,3-dioxygenase-like lactoylglutathione lyase family enzyme
MAAPELVAFHLGMVVHDIDATIERYRGLLGADVWRSRTVGTPESPIRMAYGRGFGIAFELFQVQAGGSSQFHEFLERHGEGVQHIGYWTPDVRASVKAALEAGGTLVAMGPGARGGVVAQVAPAAVDLDNLRPITFVDAGLAAVRIEFAGPGSETGLREWLQEDFDKIINPPPWL